MKFVSLLAIPDTGADHCMFPLSFASALGLDPLKMKSQGTAGVGSYNVPTYYSNVTLRFVVCGQPQEQEIYAGFTAGLEQQGIGLLGQTGFFDRYKVGFERKAGLFFIELPDPDSAPPESRP